MPTCGWILEDARDRYAEGVLRFAQMGEPASTCVTYRCPYCGHESQSEVDRNRHVGLEHPLDLPVLQIGGAPVVKQSVFRKKLEPSEIRVHQATECRLRKAGGAWHNLPLRRLAPTLASIDDSYWTLELARKRPIDNSIARHTYEMCFSIPTDEELSRADAVFVETLAIEDISHESVQLYSDNLPDRTAAREYAAALGDYAMALVLKQQERKPRSSVGFGEFAPRMRGALEVLRHFNQPVALAVCSSIRFNLNEFRDIERAPQCDSEAGELFFRSIVAGTEDQKPDSGCFTRSMKPICPVDPVTGRLLQVIRQIFCGEVLATDAFLDLAATDGDSPPISEQDMVKMNAMCAWSHLRHGRTQDSTQYLQALRFNSEFGQWATENLERDT